MIAGHPVLARASSMIEPNSSMAYVPREFHDELDMLWSRIGCRLLWVISQFLVSANHAGSAPSNTPQCFDADVELPNTASLQLGDGCFRLAEPNRSIEQTIMWWLSIQPPERLCDDAHLAVGDLSHRLAFPSLDEHEWRNLMQLHPDTLFDLVNTFLSRIPLSLPDRPGVNFETWMIWAYDILWALDQVYRL